MKKKILSAVVACILILSAAMPLLSLPASAEGDDDPVSPALYILAENAYMAMSGLSGNAISFDSKDFGRAMNLSEISAITVTQLPPISGSAERGSQA